MTPAPCAACGHDHDDHLAGSPGVDASCGWCACQGYVHDDTPALDPSGPWGAP